MFLRASKCERGEDRDVDVYKLVSVTQITAHTKFYLKTRRRELSEQYLM